MIKRLRIGEKQFLSSKRSAHTLFDTAKRTNSPNMQDAIQAFYSGSRN